MGSQPLDAQLIKMPLVAAPAAPAAQETRKKSLKEQPSYLKEVSVALNRGEELKKLKERLSAAKLIMEKDPSAKPWGETSSSQNQAPEYLSGVFQRRFPLKTTTDSIPLLQVDRFVNVAQKA